MCLCCACFVTSVFSNCDVCVNKPQTLSFSNLAENASLNAGNVSLLDRQNLSKYSAGPCEWSRTKQGVCVIVYRCKRTCAINTRAWYTIEAVIGRESIDHAYR